MAGHDLEVDSPQFVALEIDLHVCVAADHFRSDVERELFDILSNRDLPDGRRGLFHPDNFTFGQPVYLSAIYAAAHQVTGVESVEVRTFQRLGVADGSGAGERPARYRPVGDRAAGQRSQFCRTRPTDDFSGRRQMSANAALQFLRLLCGRQR